MELEYFWLPSSMIVGNEAVGSLIEECSELYSSNYGIWSMEAKDKAGDAIKLSSRRIYEWLNDDNAAIYYAKDGELLVGYAIALKIDDSTYGKISWITQLVVRKEYRNKEIAKRLLNSIWGFTDDYAWGIISANPYAIRALEKTTRRRVNPQRIKRNIRKILTVADSHVPYVNRASDVILTNAEARINTMFFVDHSEIQDMIDDVTAGGIPWTLGKLDEGWEWIAFTFKDQIPFELTAGEIEGFLQASNSFVKNAYSRMDMGSDKQKWANHTSDEVDYIIKECGITTDSSVVDFGCGQGRHCVELAHRNIKNVVGVDYIKKSVEIANEKIKDYIKNDAFICADCRTVSLGKNFDVAICLYDVVGTYADDNDNRLLIENIYKHLKPDGIALISVMNYESTLHFAKNTFVLEEEPDMLLRIKPNNIMETTGNIFDPDYYLVDTKEKVIYRREQFSSGRSLPAEFIVRDRRFTSEEIIGLCQSVGFIVEDYHFMNAANWNERLDALNKRSKEILVKCRKPKEQVCVNTGSQEAFLPT